MPIVPFSPSFSPPVMQMVDIINMPTHSYAPPRPPPSVSLWSSIRGSDLVGAACINKGMNITMLCFTL